jgi:hypothetical protein
VAVAGDDLDPGATERQLSTRRPHPGPDPRGPGERPPRRQGARRRGCGHRAAAVTAPATAPATSAAAGATAGGDCTTPTTATASTRGSRPAGAGGWDAAQVSPIEVGSRGSGASLYMQLAGPAGSQRPTPGTCARRMSRTVATHWTERVNPAARRATVEPAGGASALTGTWTCCDDGTQPVGFEDFVGPPVRRARALRCAADGGSAARGGPRPGGSDRSPPGVEPPRRARRAPGGVRPAGDGPGRRPRPATALARGGADRGAPGGPRQDFAAKSDLTVHVLAALRRLPADQRVVIVMRFWADASEAEVAQALASRSARSRARTSRA